MDLTKLHLHWGMSTYKGTHYRSYSLAYGYREHGKNRKKIVVKLGKLTDSEVATWRGLLHALKHSDTLITTRDDIIVTRHYAYLDVAAVNAIWDEWDLGAAFPVSGKRLMSTGDIARILTINRSIAPAAKSQIPDWFRETALSWILGVDGDLVNRPRLFRELTAIDQCKEAICDHLFTRMKHQNQEALKLVFYDLSSTTFSGTRCLLTKWGHCKEGYRHHVVLALVVNADGLPFYWEVLPGGTADAPTIIWLLERLTRRFDGLRPTFVFDRGMVSESNLERLQQAGIKYISAMDRNQVETLTGLDFTIFSQLTPDQIDTQAGRLDGFTKLNEITYYREIPVKGNRRYLLCFNPTLFTEQRRARARAVAEFRTFVTHVNAELDAAQKSRQRQATYRKFTRQLLKKKLSSFVDVTLHRKHVTCQQNPRKIRTYQAEVIIDQAARLKAGRCDGFWLLVTNHVERHDTGFHLLASQVISPYREKTLIESAFRDIKSFIEVSPVYVWTEAHVKAHYSCCVLSYLLNRTLDIRLHAHPGETTAAIVSHERFYKCISECQLDQIEVTNMGISTYNMTKPTDEHAELLERVGLTTLLSTHIVKTARANTPSA